MLSSFPARKANKRTAPAKKPVDHLPPVAPEAFETEEPKKKQKKHRPFVAKSDLTQTERARKHAIDENDNDKKELIRQLPFCCAGQCLCKQNHPEAYALLRERGHLFLQPEDGGCVEYLAHRACCHGLYQRWETGETEEEYNKRKDTWVPPVMKTYDDAGVEKFTRESLNTLNKESELIWVGRDQIIGAYNALRSRATQIVNDGQFPSEGTRLGTSKVYKALRGSYFKRMGANFKMKNEERPKAAVLDMFGGIGAATLVLKKLELGMSKVVYVEHDKVAVHVFRSNHDPGYNENLPQDGVEYVINPPELDFEKFAVWQKEKKTEECENMLKKFLATHGVNGKIDIAVGGPPCGSYLKVNAYREGLSCLEGSYLPMFGRMIKMMEDIQEAPLIFMAESIVLKGDDLAEVGEAFKLTYDPVQLNAHYLSPATRDRMYWSNLPFNDNIDYEGAEAKVGQETCLEEGMVSAARLAHGEDNDFSKSNCFMASYSRLETPLCMHVFKNDPNPPLGQFFGRPYTAKEREKLMGLRPDYVVGPVRELFKVLMDDALCLQTLVPDKDVCTLATGLMAQDKRGWRDRLDEKYRCFRGNYGNFKSKGDFHRFDYDFSKEIVDPKNHIPIKLKLAPPPTAHEEAREWLSCEQWESEEKPKEDTPKEGASKEGEAAKPKEEKSELATPEEGGSKKAASLKSEEGDPVLEEDKNSSVAQVPTFFDADLYAKHLIGNSFSIPVMEHLLRYASNVFHEKPYEGFDYEYEWVQED